MDIAQVTAAELAGRGKRAHTGSTMKTSCKLWAPNAAVVTAIVGNSGRSRNDVINRLIEAGFESVSRHWTADEYKRITTFHEGNIHQVVTED